MNEFSNGLRRYKFLTYCHSKPADATEKDQLMQVLAGIAEVCHILCVPNFHVNK